MRKPVSIELGRMPYLATEARRLSGRLDFVEHLVPTRQNCLVGLKGKVEPFLRELLDGNLAAREELFGSGAEPTTEEQVAVTYIEGLLSELSAKAA